MSALYPFYVCSMSALCLLYVRSMSAVRPLRSPVAVSASVSARPCRPPARRRVRVRVRVRVRPARAPGPCPPHPPAQRGLSSALPAVRCPRPLSAAQGSARDLKAEGHDLAEKAAAAKAAAAAEQAEAARLRLQIVDSPEARARRPDAGWTHKSRT